VTSAPAMPNIPQPKRQRIPKAIREAIDALASGRAQNKKTAAEKFGHISREYFSRSFQKPAVFNTQKKRRHAPLLWAQCAPLLCSMNWQSGHHRALPILLFEPLRCLCPKPRGRQ
jgi:hypothetical protein